MLDFIIYPLHVANGTIGRDEIKNRLMQSAKECGLTAIDKLRFYKEVEKAAGEAPRAVDTEYGIALCNAALDMAKTITHGTNGEFSYNGCTYQLRMEIEYDLSDADKYRGEHAVMWRKAKKKLDECNREIAVLRNRQASLRKQMETAGKNYANAHPCYTHKAKHTLVVLDKEKEPKRNA